MVILHLVSNKITFIKNTENTAKHIQIRKFVKCYFPFKILNRINKYTNINTNEQVKEMIT